ncbi:subclass B1 metallo-beta-lactamase [Flagellimonas pacifica]|nr:subclass B1 metallo-beta-lactamase [Allomuricauda parva]
MKILKICSFIVLTILGCKTEKKNINYKSENLTVQQLTENSFVHVSYLETESFGRVACNGMVVANNGEAIIFDTPSNNEVSADLINWVKKELNCTVKAVVATHFHVDCIGGLETFHNNDILSYANDRTIELVKETNGIVPKNGFSNSMELHFGSEKVILDYLGEGHTSDNIIGYFSKDRIMFGGCLLKSIGAGKGNLEDANIGEWSNTVAKVKSQYPEATVVIPGHGKTGGRELLDFTIELFKN